MKKHLLFPVAMLASMTVSAQLTIGAGAQLSVSGNAQITLHNTNFVNHGSFAAGNSIVRFTGNLPTSIGGSLPTQFFELEINKTNNDPYNNPVFLGRPISITQRLLFTAGFLNPNSHNIDLGSTGYLDGEKETSRVIGSSGGKLIANAVLNAPNNANPGNLGMTITSSKDLGNVVIRRGDQPHATTPGVTIVRYYDVIPENNANLNATLRFHYLNAELYGTNENSLVFARSTNNGISFTNIGFTTRDTVANYVEKTGINSFARWTLANSNFALPVQFVEFNVKCEGRQAVITWKTAQEQNSSHFNIEGSVDGAHWTVIGNIKAAGNSSSEKSYSFTDNNPGQRSYYRIAQYDLDASAHYTHILRAACLSAEDLSIWPNPFRDRIFVNIVTGNATPALIKIFDSKGVLVKMQRVVLFEGNNKIAVETGHLANGAYMLSVEWNNGQMKKLVQVLKQ